MNPPWQLTTCLRVCPGKTNSIIITIVDGWFTRTPIADSNCCWPNVQTVCPEGGASMHLKNLDCNILHELSHGCECRDAPGPYSLDRIYRKFADIPAPSIRSEVLSLQTAGLVKMHHLPREVFLTDAAMKRIKASRQCFEQAPHAHLKTCIQMLCRKKRSVGVQQKIKSKGKPHDRD